MAQQPVLSAAENYEKTKLATTYVENSRYDPTKTNNREPPFVADTAKSATWNYGKAASAREGGKFMPKLPVGPDGKKSQNKITATQILKYITDKSKGGFVFLDSVPRNLYSRAGLSAVFAQLDFFLANFATGVPASFRYLGNTSNVPAVRVPNGSEEGAAQAAVADFVHSSLELMDIENDGRQFDAFQNDNGFVNVRLAGKPAPQFSPNDVAQILQIVADISNHTLIKALISTGLAGGQVNMGILYKVWMAIYILNNYGLGPNNYPQKMAIINDLSAPQTVTKKKKESQYTVMEYVFLRQFLRNTTTVAVIEKTGQKIGNIDNYVMMTERPNLVETVVNLVKASAGQGQQQQDGKVYYYGALLGEKPKRVNITNFPSDKDLNTDKVKPYATIDKKFVPVNAFTFEHTKGDIVEVISVPQGLLVSGPTKISKPTKSASGTSTGKAMEVGGERAVATALFALGVYKDIEQAIQSTDSAYGSAFTALVKRQRGGVATKKSSKQGTPDLSMMSSGMFSRGGPGFSLMTPSAATFGQQSQQQQIM